MAPVTSVGEKLWNVDAAFLAGVRESFPAGSLRLLVHPFQASDDILLIDVGLQATGWYEAQKGGMVVQLIGGLRIQPPFSYVGFWLGIGGGADEHDAGHAFSFGARVGLKVFPEVLSAEIAVSREILSYGQSDMVHRMQYMGGLVVHIPDL